MSRASEELSREAISLEKAFKEGTQVEILASDKEGWRRLHASIAGGGGGGSSSSKAGAKECRAVGVGTEGNDGSGPPILVQVATRGLVLIELPRARPGGEISSELKALLADEGVTKVFCDSAANRDVRSLGLAANSPGVVNLERLAAERFGPGPVRGISRIAGLVLGRRVAKGDAADWAELESNGHVRSLSDVSQPILRYAALEAYSTLRTWEALELAWREHKLKHPSSEASDPLDKDVRADEEDAELQALDDEIAALQSQLTSLGETSGDTKRKNKQSRDMTAEEGQPKAKQPAAKERSEDKGLGVKKKDKQSERSAVPQAASSASWSGWMNALDAELRAAGGKMPWKELQGRVVERRKSCAGEEQNDAVATWRLEALAAIPQKYLSKSDGLVRLPGSV